MILFFKMTDDANRRKDEERQIFFPLAEKSRNNERYLA